LYPIRRPATLRRRFGYLGQLDRRKRVDVLVESFVRSRIDADLMIAGTGPDNDKLRQLAGDDPRIIFMGFLPDSKLGTFYNSLTALVLPSYMEGWGLPAVEAMACGVPVVVLDDSVMPEEVRGRCYKVNSLAGWFDHMDEGMKLERNEYVDWARSHTWDRCINEYENVYRRVALGSCVV
jgi:glycosyltransferase involved in cell wall biosynthesis